MFGSEMLDVAIGMVFVYLLLSLICSAVNEIIEAWLKKRATDLEKGIRELLQDYDGANIVQDLYNHPLVSGLFRGDYNHKDIKHETRIRRNPLLLSKIRKNAYRLRGLLFNRGGADLPSYIPSRNFALALIDLVMRPDASTASPTQTPPVSSPPTSPPFGSPPESFLDAYTVEELRDAISRYARNPNVKKALVALVSTAGDINQARQSIENWYDSSMDRVSGWYKRRSQVILLCIGIIAAVLVNADTIAIFKSLMNDPPLRKSLVAAAQEYAKPNPTPSPAGGGEQATLPDACKKDPNSAACKALPDACQKDQNSPQCKVEANLEQIQKFGLPVGWDCKDPRVVPQCVEFSPYPWRWVLWYPSAWSLWETKVAGWILTAIALSLGAPFWFDLLNKFMIVRSTVKPQEKSPEETQAEKHVS
jgi:hypothetical protein